VASDGRLSSTNRSRKSDWSRSWSRCGSRGERKRREAAAAAEEAKRKVEEAARNLADFK